MNKAIILENSSMEELRAMMAQLLSEQQVKIQPPKSADHEYLTRKEVCQMLKITLPTLSYYTKNGIISGYRFGRRVLYKMEDITVALAKIPNVKYRRGL